MTGLRKSRQAALYGIAVIIAATSSVAFAESYRGLYLWAAGHGLHGLWAALFPLQVDTFLVVGELALFVALADRWAPRSRAAAWAVTLTGLAVSVAGNVGHVAGHSLADRATAAVPPLAAAAALAVGLGVLKRVVEKAAVPAQVHDPGPVPELAEAFASELESGRLPGVRTIKRRLKVGQPRAQEVRGELEQVLASQSVNGHAEMAGRLS